MPVDNQLSPFLLGIDSVYARRRRFPPQPRAEGAQKHGHSSDCVRFASNIPVSDLAEYAQDTDNRRDGFSRTPSG